MIFTTIDVLRKIDAQQSEEVDLPTVNKNIDRVVMLINEAHGVAVKERER